MVWAFLGVVAFAQKSRDMENQIRAIASLLPLHVPPDAVDDLLPRAGRTDPALDLDPFAALEVLVVLEEMGNCGELRLGDVARRLDTAVDARQLLDRHREHFRIVAGLV